MTQRASAINADSAAMMMDRLEEYIGRELTQDERNEIEVWQKGKALAPLTGFYGWEVVMEMLRSYAEDAIQRLIVTDPGDTTNIVGFHAAAYAANKIYHNFATDVKNAIDKKTPEIMRGYVKKHIANGAPDSETPAI